MALRRRQGGIGRSSTFKEEKTYRPPPEEKGPPPTHSSSSSLPAQANMSSSNHRDSSHSPSSSFKDHHYNKGGPTNNYTSMEGSNEAGSFWGVLARKAKAILDDDNSVPYQSEYPILTRPEPAQHSRQVRPETVNISRQVRPETANPSRPVHQGENSTKNNDNPTLRKGLVALTTSMSRIGDSLGNALEEGRTIVENKTSDFMEETRNNIQIRRKGVTTISTQNHTSQEDLLKASRDVAMATAAKTKLLLRELKTVKADLAFARQRCSQLEEENRALVEGHEKGIFPGDDDMIRLQLETLLAEKARLAHENSVYECENRFLREIVEYHQLTMQDIVYLDEGIEEVTEVYDYPTVQSGRVLSGSPPVSPAARRNSFSSSLSRSSSVAKEMLSLSSAPREKKNINNDTPSA